MPIKPVSDNVFRLGPERCDGMAVWVHRRGEIGALWAAFREKVGPGGAERWHNQQWTGALRDNPRMANHPDLDDRNELPPDLPEVATLFRLKLPAERLQYLFLYERSSDNGVPSEHVRGMVHEALTELDRVGCRTIAMNGIHGVGGGTQRSSVDIENAKSMIATIRQWFAANPRRNIEEVHLVDLKDGFLAALAGEV